MPVGHTDPADANESLLEPISADSPAGEWLRYSPVMDQIAEARRHDDPSLPQGVWQKELKRADWHTVDLVCRRILITQSKDLQVAVFLLEAWLHLRGMAGVHEGIALIRALVERYWDLVHPPLVEGEPEARVAPLRWLNDKLALEIRLMPLLSAKSPDPVVGRWIDRETAMHEYSENSAEAHCGDSFSEALTATPTADLVGHVATLDGALLELDALEAFLDTQCGAEAPGFSELRGVLVSVRSSLSGQLRSRPPLPPQENPLTAIASGAATIEDSDSDIDKPGRPQLSESSGQKSAGTSQGVPILDGEIQSRADAYRVLSIAAEYLMRTEPHSPTPYLVRRAVAWRDMSLDELLQELFTDTQDAHAVQRLLGIGKATREN